MRFHRQRADVAHPGDSEVWAGTTAQSMGPSHTEWWHRHKVGAPVGRVDGKWVGHLGERADFSCALRRLRPRDSPAARFEPQDATQRQMPSTFLESEGECYKNPFLRLEDTLVPFSLLRLS